MTEIHISVYQVRKKKNFAFSTLLTPFFLACDPFLMVSLHRGLNQHHECKYRPLGQRKDIISASSEISLLTVHFHCRQKAEVYISKVSPNLGEHP